MRWRYAYPQAAFPYEDLIEVNGGALTDRARVRAARHRRVRPRLVGRRRSSTPRPTPATSASASRSATPGPSRRRCTCCRRCGSATPGPGTRARPSRRSRRVDDGALRAEHEQLGTVVLAGDGAPEPLFCDNETNTRRLWGAAGPPIPRMGSTTTRRPARRPSTPSGRRTKAALHYQPDGRRPATPPRSRLRLAPDAA